MSRDEVDQSEYYVKGEPMGVTAQVEFTADELLADAPVVEPLIAGGVRCHGGFDDDGSYVSPRTQFRVPAIEAWTARHAEVFSTPLVDAPLETWGTHFPNVDQARFLIRSGVPEPLVATLTRIGTVEGYGANIRLLQPSGLQRWFVEDIRGTAIDHLGQGLFEAHGRDEAGWEEEAGHKDMWFAARDIAFENPSKGLDVQAMLERMGFSSSVPSGLDAPRLLPSDINAELEFMVTLMIRVLFIEISAFHAFRWAEDWLSDPDLVAGDGEAAKLVSYIRADETPHVSYLTIAISEMRARTWIGESGKHYSGAAQVDKLWNHLLDQSLGSGRESTRKAIQNEIEHWCLQRPNGTDILAEFTSFASVA